MSNSHTWKYSAETASGEIISGQLNAENLAGAKSELSRRGLTPFDLELQKQTRFNWSIAKSKTILKSADWVHFSGRMSELVNAGIPLADALNLIARQAQGKVVGGFAKALSNRLRRGQRLSSAISEVAPDAPRLLLALISTGEAVGDLGHQFSRLKTDFETRQKLRREIIGNLIYPAALFVLMILTLIFLSFVVLPQFETVFTSSSAEPPSETKFVLAAGAFIRNWWSLALAMLAVAILLSQLLIRRYPERWERLMIAIPGIGNLLHQSETARYCRSLGALLIGGTSLARAMPIALEAVSLHEVRRRLANTEHEVRSGSALFAALAQHKAVTSDSIDLIELGESTGNLGKMTIRAADFTDDSLADTLKKFAALSGPAMIAIMGVLTAGVIASVMTGVMSLNDVAY